MGEQIQVARGAHPHEHANRNPAHESADQADGVYGQSRNRTSDKAHQTGTQGSDDAAEHNSSPKHRAMGHGRIEAEGSRVATTATAEMVVHTMRATGMRPRSSSFPSPKREAMMS